MQALAVMVTAASAMQTPSGGKFQLAVANDATGPWSDLGPPQDTFAASPTFTSFGPFSSPLFGTA